MCRHRSPRRSPVATPAPPRRGRRRCGIAARCAAAAAAPPGRAVLSELRNVAVLLADRLNVVLCGLRQDLAGRGAGLGRRDLALVLLVSDLDAARRRRLTGQAVEERLADAARLQDGCRKGSPEAREESGGARTPAPSRQCLGYLSAMSRLCLAGSESMKEPSVSVKGRFEFMVICCGIFFACAYLRIFWSICAEGRGRAR